MCIQYSGKLLVNLTEELVKHNKMSQACEQLNAWLGGYESILKRMTPGNFDWFLHTMLFFHTQHVLHKQAKQASNSVDGSNTDSDEGENEE